MRCGLYRYLPFFTGIDITSIPAHHYQPIISVIVCSLLPGIDPNHAVILSDTDTKLLEDIWILLSRPLTSQCRSLMGPMKIERCSRNTATKQSLFQDCIRNSAISLSEPDSVFRLFVSRTDFITALIFSSKEWLRKAMKVEPNIFGAQSSKSPVSQKIRLPRIFWGQSSHEPQHCWHSLGSPCIKFSSPIENQTVDWRLPFDWP